MYIYIYIYVYIFIYLFIYLFILKIASWFRFKIEDLRGYNERHLSDQLIFSVSRYSSVTFLSINICQRSSSGPGSFS